MKIGKEKDEKNEHRWDRDSMAKEDEQRKTKIGVNNTIKWL